MTLRDAFDLAASGFAGAASKNERPPEAGSIELASEPLVRRR